MAFCHLQHLRHRLTTRRQRMSPGRIHRALKDLEISTLHWTGGKRRFGMPSGKNSDTCQIYRTLGLIWNRGAFVYAPARKPRGVPRQRQLTSGGRTFRLFAGMQCPRILTKSLYINYFRRTTSGTKSASCWRGNGPRPTSEPEDRLLGLRAVTRIGACDLRDR